MKLKEAKQSKSKFLYIVIAAWIFVISLTLLNIAGFVPYYIDGTPSKAVLAAAEKRDKDALELAESRKEELANATGTDAIIVHPVLPTRLLIPATGVDLVVSNPDTTDIDELDRELLTSVVRYPGSGALGSDGNMLIFGHSTGYRTVRNDFFKAFNSLKTLEEGNVVKLISGDTEYLYTVNKLEHKDAAEVTIDFATEPGVQRLTLSTCDSFGAKSDRWIITADFIGSYPVEEQVVGEVS